MLKLLFLMKGSEFQNAFTKKYLNVISKLIINGNQNVAAGDLDFF